MPDAKATFALVGDDQTAAAFRSALGNTQVFAKQANELLKGAFELGGVSFAADLIKQMTDLGRNLQDGAERAGIAQGDFNQLAAAFDEAGVSAESLSKGIKNMQVALSEAAGGDKGLTKAFQEIGLSATSLKQLAPDVQLLAIAEAISKIPDPADRARLGAQLLGKQFLELEPELMKGAAALDALVKAAHGMDPEDTKSLADAAHWISTIGTNIKMMSADLLGTAGNALSEMWSTFTKAANPLAEVNRQLEALDKNLRAPVPTGNVLSALSEQGKGQMEAATQAILKSLIDANSAEEEMDMKAAAERAKLMEQEEKDTRTQGDKRIAFEAMVDDITFKSHQTDAERRVNLEAAADDAIAAHRRGEITQIEAFRRIYAKDQAASNKVADELAKTANSGAIDAAFKDTEKGFDESAAAMAAKSRLMTESMAEDWNKTKANAQQAAASIEDSFATFLVDPFSGGLKKMLAAWVQTIDQMVAKAAAQQVFKSLFGNMGLGSIFSAFLTSGSGGSAANVDLNSNNVTGHATGASWKVGGSGGTDSQLVRFRASPDETVSVTRPGQNAGSAPSVIFSPTYQFGSGVNRTDVVQACAATQKATIAEISKMIRGGRFG